MSKQLWKPGNMLYPLPAVLVTTRNQNGAEDICTVAWAGTVCTNPPMISISLRKSRLTYEYLCETGFFGVNLTTEALAFAADFCGVRSGREIDKFRECGLHKFNAEFAACPLVSESPINIECKVARTLDLGSHTMFIASVLAIHADEAYMDGSGRFDLALAKPIVYSHGMYAGLGKSIGTFGYSVRKKSEKCGHKVSEKTVPKPLKKLNHGFGRSITEKMARNAVVTKEVAVNKKSAKKKQISYMENAGRKAQQK